MFGWKRKYLDVKADRDRIEHDRLKVLWQNQRLDAQVRELTKLAAKYREEAERLYHTPEVKADTESAFKRGEELQRRKLLPAIGQLQQHVRESQQQAKAAIDEAFGPAWEYVESLNKAMQQ